MFYPFGNIDMKKNKNITIDNFAAVLRMTDCMLIETGGNERIVFEIISSNILRAKKYTGSQADIIKTIDLVYDEYNVSDNKDWKHLDKMLFILSEIKDGILSNKTIFYHLKKVHDCQMTSVSWFWLTDSYYYLQLGKERIYEYSDRAVRKDKMKSHFLDYYFIRFLEDIFDVLIETIQPMPKEIYQIFDTDKKFDKLSELLTLWYYGNRKSKKYLEPPKEKETIYNCLGKDFLWNGCLDSSFISGSILCRFVHVEDKFYIHYDCSKQKKIWTAGKNIFELPYKEFIFQIETLIEDFFLDMDKQVADAIAIHNEDEYSWNNLMEAYKKKFPEQFIDSRKTGAEYLMEEHSRRKFLFREKLEQIKSGRPNVVLDWKEIKEKLRIIKNDL